ncbi:acyl carrier protein phosphodiesterase [Flagellimonas halotolerans]|uniref:Acyl carrier protein phosphodiesterase n=1 Tax=Flagellimonas halotolerans TaxID=3112164 RepID=A0ABU6IN07_9FLAO|nr:MULTISPECIES: acyl carrier protein phosphodiesterase [unclassified Allomuricauda]MEC3964574.1 acyl carrier protein phosphodiesterase [Muricauda sp. SYSU M86414]MEC4264443.1 acyl carrier protein phosphodiesterase [Muricauda sp. SYSU M84420]
MNFLAHIYLSFDDKEITLGNFFADHIRGNKYKHLPDKIQKGILLHREIDTFTDSHPIVRQSSKRLHKNYSHYSRVIVDIYYDHFLAKNWSDYSKTPLDEFVEDFYDLLEDNYDILPMATKRMMPYMITDNWLLNYANLAGIDRVLNGMNRRTKNKSKMNFAILDLEEHYTDFENEFTSFFKELITFSNQKFISLCKD